MSSQQSLTTKIFVGYPITSEVQMHLNHSIKWKHANIMPEESAQELKIVYTQGKNYIGCYLDHDRATLTELKEIGRHVEQRLGEYCPKYETKNVEMVVFPQVFIA